jgi:hypothetical protein
MIKVTLPYDPLWTALDWANEYCPSYITHASGLANLKSVPGGRVDDASIVYYFNDERDAVFFSLRWS